MYYMNLLHIKVQMKTMTFIKKNKYNLYAKLFASIIYYKKKIQPFYNINQKDTFMKFYNIMQFVIV